MLLQILKSILTGTKLAGQAEVPAEVPAHKPFLPPPAHGEPRYLNIGCGNHRLDGFTNIDLDAHCADLRLDVREGLPFDDQSVDGIRTEHFLEHLSKHDAYVFMREARRVLKKDGVLRISMPDLGETLAAYAAGSKMEWERAFGYDWIRTRCEMVNVAMREWGHQWLYDQKELDGLGAQTGFRLLGWPDIAGSTIERFRGVDYRADSMVAEFMPACGVPADAGLTQPKVSVLIPAYNPRYFEAALQSAVMQDYPDKEIIVADDSLGGEIKAICDKYAGVTYIRNNPASGPAFNYQTLFHVATGDYIKYLNDDDVLLPDCIAIMARMLAAQPEVSLVTSYRQAIDSSGQVQPDTNNIAILQQSGILNGQYAAHLMVSKRWNYIGEPSTTMFRKQQLANFGPALFDFFGQEILGNIDMVMWLKLLSVGDLCYYASPLSQCRYHSQQIQRDPKVIPFLVESLRILEQHATRVGLHALVPTQTRVLHVEL